MRRLLVAGALAMGLHGFLLGARFDGLERLLPPRPANRQITVTLAYRPPRPVEPAPAPPAPPEPRPPATPAAPAVTPKPAAPSPKPKRAPSRPVPAPLRAKAAAAPPPAVEPTPEPSPTPTSEPVSPMAPRTEAAAPPVPRSFSASTSNVPAPPAPAPPPPVVEARPLYLDNPAPSYPSAARRRGWTGTVMLEVRVGTNGTVVDVRVASSSGHPMLDRAAESAVRGWSFVPGRRGDDPLEMWVRVPIRFELK